MPGVIGIEEVKFVSDEILHLHLIFMCYLHNIEPYTMIDVMYACLSINNVNLLTILQHLW